jgi:outer membrane scaffolding protein for murein synthesis (MipA/OmpV family)
MRAPRCVAYAALAVAALVAVPASADKPLWEFGLGLGVLSFNDYRGADTTHVYALPLPYFIYRGTLFKADREGVRSLLFNQDRVELNLSVNATTPVRNDSARAGMPDLRSTLEIGPQLQVHLWRSTDARVKLDLRVPVRAAFTVQADPRYVGLFVAPNISLDIAQLRGEDGWKLGLLAGPLFANQRYDAYFYTVAPQYATATRAAYDAPGGYAGAQVLAALTRRFPSYWIGAYVRHDTLSGASFADSPLVKRDSYWSAGVGIAWIIKQSTQMVVSEE